MSSFQRIKNIVIGVVIILFAVFIMMAPQEGYLFAAVVISLWLFIYGIRLLFFYFTMARHMVGGKLMLYQAIIILDLALFTTSIISMSSFTIFIYLLIIYGFTGAIDILRALEAKNNGAKNWRLKLMTGCILVIFVVLMAVLGLIFKKTDILIYGFCLSLIYSGIMKIVTAFRRTAMVYIQ